MIAKHVPMTSAKKSDFAGLVKYITGPQGKTERIGLVCITNCQADQADIAMLEVLNTQAQNTRSGADKTYHLVVSFPQGEIPEDAVLKTVEDRLCASLGFSEHQRVSVVHHDTDNLHLHIAINKIHPARYTIHEPYNAYHTLGKVCAALEAEFGLQKVNHKASKGGSENRADDMEQHAAVESLIGWIKRECIDRLQSATSWPEMHRVLLERGLRIHERGNGLIITSENGVSVKASSVSRDLSKARLEARFGAFDAAPETVLNMQAAKRYDKRPIPSRIDTADLYARYTLSQQQAKDARATEWASARDRKRQMIEDAKRNGRLKRAAIKLIHGPALAKKILYASTSKSLRDNIAAVNRKYLHDRQEIFAKHEGRAWADWLQKEARSGDQQALAALRARRPAAGHTGNTVSGQAGTRLPSPPGHDGVTKNGTVIYLVAACSIRDDGNKLTVSRGASRTGLEAALRMAIARYGEHIAVTGSDVFKDQILRAAIASNLPITFDNAELERRRKQLTQSSTHKENKHGNQSRSNGRPTDRSRNGGGGRHGAGYGGAAYARSARGTTDAKPHPGCAREEAPPAARHGLRELSALGVVHVANGREMLLPGHVPGHVERQGAQSDHGLRRDLRGPGRLNTNGTTSLPTPGSIRGAPHLAAGLETLAPAAIKAAVKRAGTGPPPASQSRLRRLSQLGAIVVDGAESPPVQPGHAPNAAMSNRSPLGNPDRPAADVVAIASAQAMHKYIIEREQKRLKGFDIPKHKAFTFTHAVTAVYAGIRRVDGQVLAVIKVNQEMMVLPVDDSAARRLKRVAIGHQLQVSANGTVKSKGRSR